MKNLNDITAKIKLDPVKLTQKDVCKTQLDRAIKCFLDEGDPISAITLALAAEGIMGERLADQSMVSQIKGTLRDKYVPAISGQELNNKHINRARNYFKHAAGEIGEEQEFDLELEAITAIMRGCVCYLSAVGEELWDSPKRFFIWLRENRPDLLVASNDLEC